MTTLSTFMNMSGLQFVLLFSCLVYMTSCDRVDEKGCPMSFSSYAYYDEWKRIPLIFPFEISEFCGNAGITRWEYYKKPPRAPVDANSPMQVTKILRFAVTNGYLFGEHDTGWVWPSGEVEYFVFSLTETNVVRYSDKVDFARHCSTFGGDIRQMRPFEEQWKTYWERHEKRKK